MKIASWNVNSLRVRLEHVQQWLQDNQPDVLCLQELKMENAQFPIDAFEKIGYHCLVNGQKTYNGVAILSKKEADTNTSIIDLPHYTDEQKRFISASFNGVRIINIYAPNGQSLDSDKFVYKRTWFKQLHQTIKELLKQNDKLILLGDFNITPNDEDVHDPQKWKDKIHCSPIERMMLQKLMSLGLYDSFRHFNQDNEQFSWWDYRNNGFARNEGLRIDLILSSNTILSQANNCLIDTTPRKLERPSDHTPVLLTLNNATS